MRFFVLLFSLAIFTKTAALSEGVIVVDQVLRGINLLQLIPDAIDELPDYESIINSLTPDSDMHADKKTLPEAYSVNTNNEEE